MKNMLTFQERQALALDARQSSDFFRRAFARKGAMTMTSTISDIIEGLKFTTNSRKAALQKEHLNLEHKMAEVELAIKGIQASELRLAELSHPFGRYDFCVPCFVNKGERFSIKPVSGGTDTEDYAKCPACHQVVSLPF